MVYVDFFPPLVYLTVGVPNVAPISRNRRGGKIIYFIFCPMIITGKALPEKHRASQELFGCDY